MNDQPRSRRSVEVRDIGFHLTLSQADRELLDRLARRQGVSRTTLLARSLHLLAHLCGGGIAMPPPRFDDLARLDCGMLKAIRTEHWTISLADVDEDGTRYRVCRDGEGPEEGSYSLDDALGIVQEAEYEIQRDQVFEACGGWIP